MKDYRDNYDLNEIALGVLRIFTGGALFIKGVNFMINMHELYDLTAQALPFSNFMIAHLIVAAHVVGGFCLMIGLLTRTSAISNIPIILGAILFVHAQEGLFSPTQGLELTVMLLVVLSVIGIAGSRFMSVDTLVNQHFKKLKEQGLLGRQRKHQLR